MMGDYVAVIFSMPKSSLEDTFEVSGFYICKLELVHRQISCHTLKGTYTGLELRWEMTLDAEATPDAILDNLPDKIHTFIQVPLVHEERIEEPKSTGQQTPMSPQPHRSRLGHSRSRCVGDQIWKRRCGNPTTMRLRGCSEAAWTGFYDEYCPSSGSANA
ncbi:hypothetical protein B0H14DRAFT_1490937 [Mycena olivaceomarginata]|nr:hypothetical protein B0H14DRAFT_1490937 [Mycena olivaceomarginata]